MRIFVGILFTPITFTVRDINRDYSKHILGPVNGKNTQSCIKFLKLNLQNKFSMLANKSKFKVWIKSKMTFTSKNKNSVFYVHPQIFFGTFFHWLRSEKIVLKCSQTYVIEEYPSIYIV